MILTICARNISLQVRVRRQAINDALATRDARSDFGDEGRKLGGTAGITVPALAVRFVSYVRSREARAWSQCVTIAGFGGRRGYLSDAVRLAHARQVRFAS